MILYLVTHSFTFHKGISTFSECIPMFNRTKTAHSGPGLDTHKLPEAGLHSGFYIQEILCPYCRVLASGNMNKRGERTHVTLISFCLIMATPSNSLKSIKLIERLKNQTCSSSGDYHSLISKSLPCNLLHFSCVGARYNNPWSLVIVEGTSFYIWPTIHHCPGYKRNTNATKLYEKLSVKHTDKRTLFGEDWSDSVILRKSKI